MTNDAEIAAAELPETATMTVWPTIAATAPGRLVGRWSALEIGPGKFFTLGKLLALVSIPVSLAVFVWQLLPYFCRRYALTNRRIIVRKGLMPVDEHWIGLDEFDTVDIEVLPGQRWLHAGELVFKRGDREMLRLSGVSRPEVFRHVCQTAQNALVSVRDAVRKELVAV